MREAGVYCEIVPFNKAEAALNAAPPKAIILSGGPAERDGRRARRARRRRCSRWACRCSASATASRRWSQQLGGSVEGRHHREFGRADIEVTGKSPLFDGVWRNRRARTECG